MKPEMRQDERYARLSYPARELFNGLITMADDEGRFRALTSAILGHVFPYDDDAIRKLKDWVTEVKASGMVVFYIVDGVPYGAFRHWKRHQKINRPTPSDLPPPPDHGVVSENSVIDSDIAHGVLTDSSVNDHGGLTSPRAGARSDPFLSLDVVRLTERLGEQIRANEPKAKPHVKSERWQNDMRLLLEERGGDVVEVERIIDWCQQDPFWRSNILSPAKLRKQFSQLLLKSEQKPSNVTQLRVAPGQKHSEGQQWSSEDEREAYEQGGLEAYQLASRGHEWRHLIPETEGAA